MVKRNTYIPLLVGASLLISMLIVQVVSADCGGAPTSVINCNSSGTDAIFDVIKMIIQILTASIGVIAVGATIFGAILYTSSGDNPENVKKAKGVWMNVVIGLMLFAFMVAITNFLIPGGVF